MTANSSVTRSRVLSNRVNFTQLMFRNGSRVAAMINTAAAIKKPPSGANIACTYSGLDSWPNMSPDWVGARRYARLNKISIVP